MQIIDIPIKQLVPYENNPRNNDETVPFLANSIKEFGFKVPIVIDKDYNIIAGHTRLKAAKKLRMKTVPCIIADDLNEEQVKAFRLADNKVQEMSEWDDELLAKELEGIFDLDMASFGFDIDDGVIEELPPDIEHIPLSERFLFTPLSVLNCAGGEWQKRKRAWYDIGLASGESREDMVAPGSKAGSTPNYYIYKRKAEEKVGHTLTRQEFESQYLDEYLSKDSTIKTTNSGGMLSLFDPVLCELMYYWFCPPGGTILDPFSGGSVRGVIASKTGHPYVGIDLREKQVEANRRQGEQLCADPMPVWACGNSLNIKTIAAGEYDLVFSCPPYFDLEQYSDDPEDLSNMSYDDFKKTYFEIIANTVSLLKENRFAIFTVGEVRNKKTGFYRNFVTDTIEAFEKAGAHFYNEIILFTPIGSLPQRITRTFQSGRKIGKTHQNVLVFFKGNPKKIKELYGDVEIQEPLAESEEIE